MKKKKSLRYVVKIGSGLLTDTEGGIDMPQVVSISRQVSQLKTMGHEVVLVSSGAISAGMTVLGLTKRPKELPMLQACATIGQPRLMHAYQTALSAFDLVNAQILVTSWDLDSRRLHANTRKTLDTLLGLGRCVPIFNENDALSFEEIEMLNTFGDNDRLSAHVALLCDADRLVILSSIDGLKTRPDGTGRLVREVHAVDKKIESYAGRTQSERSVGGMISKLNTAKMMLQAGIPLVIANGREIDILIRIARDERVGTWFQKKG